jgi:hypothetical protein
MPTAFGRITLISQFNLIALDAMLPGSKLKKRKKKKTWKLEIRILNIE